VLILLARERIADNRLKKMSSKNCMDTLLAFVLCLSRLGIILLDVNKKG
jgi:hypothetical protein